MSASPQELLKRMDISKVVNRVYSMAAAALADKADSVSEAMTEVVALCEQCPGRIIVSGIGKSALIAQKIVATLNSTGSSAIYMHAADALHGDLGILQSGDLVLIISQSGESSEIRHLVDALQRFDNKLVAMTGRVDSHLARAADAVLDTSITAEADPNNLAPTTSTTVQMVTGDALAISLQVARGFEAQDFARLHPAGSLGKRLHLRLADLVGDSHVAHTTADTSMGDAILIMSAGRKGAIAIVDDNRVCLGIITDGDLRRNASSLQDLHAIKVRDLMSNDPATMEGDSLAVDALDLLKERDISQIIVLEDGKYSGIVHLHQLLDEGL